MHQRTHIPDMKDNKKISSEIQKGMTKNWLNLVITVFAKPSAATVHHMAPYNTDEEISTNLKTRGIHMRSQYRNIKLILSSWWLYQMETFPA